MKNPKTFSGATPFSHFKPVDKSHTGTKDLVHNGTRTEQKTPWTHSGKVEKSGYEGMGMPYAKSSDRTESMTPMSHFKKIDKSMPAVPVAAKKWHKKGKYDMTLPTTLS
jgi:hypothetical protein